MRFTSVWLQLAICLGVTAAGIHKSFQSTQNTGVGLRYVSDSGICETTPGVHQTSGYIDIEPNMHLVSRPPRSAHDLIIDLLRTVVLVLRSTEQSRDSALHAMVVAMQLFICSR